MQRNRKVDERKNLGANESFGNIYFHCSKKGGREASDRKRNEEDGNIESSEQRARSTGKVQTSTPDSIFSLSLVKR